MNGIYTLIAGIFFVTFTSQITLAQGIGEYGRVLGGARQGLGGTHPKTPDARIHKGGGTYHGLGSVKERPFPTHLVVAAKAAPLYRRQGDESDQIEELPQGEVLVPMMQGTSAGIEWYMVKTRVGTIGWIKSSDVKEPPKKEP